MDQSIKDFVKEISILEIKPNQTLLLKFDQLLDPETVKCVQENISSYLGCKVLTTFDNVDISIIETVDEDSNN